MIPPCKNCLVLAMCSGAIRSHVQAWYASEASAMELHELAEEVIDMLTDKCSIMGNYIYSTQETMLRHLNNDEVPEEYYERYNGIMNFFSHILPKHNGDI